MKDHHIQVKILNHPHKDSRKSNDNPYELANLNLEYAQRKLNSLMNRKQNPETPEETPGKSQENSNNESSENPEKFTQ